METLKNLKYSRSVAINVVIANMIGTGVFTSLGYQTGSIPSWFSIMVLWCLGALISLFGALVYSEVATRIKESGGEYKYLSKIFSPWWGFMAGWISFIVGFAAPIAAVSIAIGEYTTDFFNINHTQIASLVIVIIGSIHSSYFWHGDILFIYALCSFPLYFFKNLSARKQFILGFLIYLTPSFSNYVAYKYVTDDLDPIAQNIMMKHWNPEDSKLQEEIDVYRGSYEIVETV